MHKLRVSKLSPIELSRHVMDLIMATEGDIPSIREKRVRIIWHLLFFSLCIFFIICVISLPLIRSLFPNSTRAALIWRSFVVLIFAYLLLLLTLLCFRHYKYLLRTNRDLRFNPIMFFYIMGILLFGKLYASVYLIKPELFEIIDPVVNPTPYLMDMGIKSYLLDASFNIYSACTIVSINHPHISSSSTIVSAINVLEVFYGIMIIILLVATFVQKSDHGRINK